MRYVWKRRCSSTSLRDVVDVGRSGSAARACARGPCARRRPRGGGTSRPAAPNAAGAAACRRRAAARPGAAAVAGDVLATTAMVCASTSLCRWIGILFEPHRVQLGQELVGEPGVDEEPQPRATGRRPRAACRARRGSARRDTISRRGAHLGRPRRPAPGPGSRPYPAMKRAARSIRSGSSANDTSGASGVRRRRGRQVGGAVVAGRSARRLGRSSIAIAFTVKSRRDRSRLDVGREHDLGLARIGRVRLGPVRRDLDVPSRHLRPDGPEPLPLGPHRVGPARRATRATCSGVASVVKSRSSPSAKGRSSNRSRTTPPTRYRWCPAAVEAGPEGRDLVEDRSQARGITAGKARGCADRRLRPM